MKGFEIKGLKKVAGATKAIKSDYKGCIVYDTEKNAVRFDGIWKDSINVGVDVEDTEKVFWVYGPMTMRDIVLMIAKSKSYKLYVELICKI